MRAEVDIELNESEWVGALSFSGTHASSTPFVRLFGGETFKGHPAHPAAASAPH